jgi:hypothetical protein
MVAAAKSQAKESKPAPAHPTGVSVTPGTMSNGDAALELDTPSYVTPVEAGFDSKCTASCAVRVALSHPPASTLQIVDCRVADTTSPTVSVQIMELPSGNTVRDQISAQSGHVVIPYLASPGLPGDGTAWVELEMTGGGTFFGCEVTPQ